MRTITSITEVEITVTEDDLIESRWIPFERLSAKIADKEVEDNARTKDYRNKLYNSVNGGKLNYKIFAGIKCIDVDNPMKGVASIKINFKRG